MSYPNQLAFCACVALVLGSCNLSQTPPVANPVPPLIDLPTAEARVPVADFTILPAEGGSFFTDHGTQITFPAGAFEYEDGTPVQEPVQIRFCEYHSVADIMLSGIYMQAKNEQGETLPFESAGMFDISGKAAGKNVKIAKGKTVQVDLPNPKSDTDFNFYRMDENGWTELRKNLPARQTAVTDEIRREADQELPPPPIEPEPADENTFVFDLNMDTDTYPELKELYGVMWQYAGIKGSNTDPAANPKITGTDWEESQIERTPENTFNLLLRNKTSRITVPVKPVLRGKNYAEAKARFDKRMDNYREAVDRKERAEKHLAMADRYVRSLSVSGFGIYNCDRFYRVPNPQPLQAKFISGGNDLPENAYVFQVINNNVAIRLLPYNSSISMQYSQNENNRLLAIFPDQTVGIVRGSDFLMAATNSDGAAEFDFQKLPLKDITPDRLQQALQEM